MNSQIESDSEESVPGADRFEAGESKLVQVLTPESRLRIIDAFLNAPNEPQTVTQITDRSGVSDTSFSRHQDALTEFGIIKKGPEYGNAQTYDLNRDNPIVQLLGMMDHVLRFGTTDVHLDNEWTGTPGTEYEPGDHPDDPR